MEKQIKFLRGERGPIDILSDLCVAFQTTYLEFKSRRENRKSTDTDSLICQAFVLIMKKTSTQSMKEIGKHIERSKSQVSIFNDKGNRLLISDHIFARNWQMTVAKSCPEGLLLFTKIINKND